MSRYIEGGVKINSLGEFFGGQDDKPVNVDISELHSFKNHPFKVKDDEDMEKLVSSIREHGKVLEPGIVRIIPSGGYEIISGHRRKRACEIIGLKEMPVIIKKLTDDEAAIAMVDYNLKREVILPSEKAFAYKMKLEALSHQGKLKEEASEDETSRRTVGKLESADLVGQIFGESGRQVQRYIRLTALPVELLDMVDDKKMKLYPAVELSYLPEKQQKILINVMMEDDVVPSLTQAQQLRKLSQEKAFTKESVHAILLVSTEKERKVTIKQNIISRYFPPDTTEEEIESIICTLLDEWQRNGGKS